MRTGFLVVAMVAVLCGAATDARAELVFFTTGGTLSVRSYSIQGESIVFELRGGGQATCQRALVERIAPDEVPYAVASPASPSDAHISSAGAEVSARPFADLISTIAAAHGVDARLVHAIVEVESNYQPRARSRKGAKGLMQLMPATARQYALRDPFDPKSNLEAGVRHLKDLLSRFDLSLALAAYNAGEATVREHRGVPPFPETRSYVRRVMQRFGSPLAQVGPGAPGT